MPAVYGEIEREGGEEPVEGEEQGEYGEGEETGVADRAAQAGEGVHGPEQAEGRTAEKVGEVPEVEEPAGEAQEVGGGQGGR